MKVILPGGSGHVGTLLAKAFYDQGHEVVVLSRHPRSTPWKSLSWDGVHLGDWAAEVDGADVVINLAGRSVNCRYGSQNRQAILDSRVNSTRAISECISRASHPPSTWLQMSTATIYAHRYDSANDEATGVIGGREPDLPDTWKFSIEVAQAWERVALREELPDTRRVLMRTAIVMNPGAGGPFHLLQNLVRCGLGGKAGDGKQFMSWIHGADLISAIAWLIKHEEIEGVVNLAAPHPLSNAEFMRVLREVNGIPFGLPSPKALLEIGTFFLRTESELVLKSRRVVPGKLLESGFSFQFPDWPHAAKDLVKLRGASATAVPYSEPDRIT